MEQISVRSRSGEIRQGEKIPIKRKMRNAYIQLKFNPPISLGELSGGSLCTEAIFEISSGKRFQRDGISPNDFILLDDWTLVG